MNALEFIFFPFSFILIANCVLEVRRHVFFIFHAYSVQINWMTQPSDRIFLWHLTKKCCNNRVAKINEKNNKEIINIHERTFQTTVCLSHRSVWSACVMDTAKCTSLSLLFLILLKSFVHIPINIHLLYLKNLCLFLVSHYSIHLSKLNIFLSFSG